jgi:hypothetical protein
MITIGWTNLTETKGLIGRMSDEAFLIYFCALYGCCELQVQR